MEFILASNNKHKALEFNKLIEGNVFQVISSEKSFEVDETGETFSQNAYLKASYYFRSLNKPTMADDSGLVVPSLPSDLGVHSARFGGPSLTDRQRCELLIKKLEQFEVNDTENRRAYFVCLLCFILSKDEMYFFEGRLKGQISLQLKGEGGFGYDCVFIPEDHANMMTLAEDAQWKADHSHRYKAIKQAEKFFLSRPNWQQS